jgi:hypothetical protein
MRAYVPVTRVQLAAVQGSGLDGPLRACAVDPLWRAGDPSVDEEQWEYEAQSLAAGVLPDRDGVVLAVEVADDLVDTLADGWLELPGPVRRTEVAAVLTAELAWFAVQEIPALLDG